MTGYTSKKAATNAKLEQAKEILLQSPQKDIEWQREQQIKAHAKLNDDDDDTQVYKKPWVGLTDEEVELYWDWEDFQIGAGRSTILEMVRDIEAKLKDKNNAA